jgi:hypothetical protein
MYHYVIVAKTDESDIREEYQDYQTAKERYLELYRLNSCNYLTARVEIDNNLSINCTFEFLYDCNLSYLSA